MSGNDKIVEMVESAEILADGKVEIVEPAEPPEPEQRETGQKKGRKREGGEPFPLTFFGDIDANARKEWLITTILGKGELSVIYGPPGSAKSAAVGDMAFHVAAGLDWAGRRVTPGAVLYIAAERASLVKRRLLALRMRYGHDSAPLAVISGPVNFGIRGPDVSRIVATVRDLEEKGGAPCVWVIIDTKSRTMAGADENSPKDMGLFVCNMAEIQEHTGAHVTVLDHQPHDAQRMRGHGALLGACDTTFRISNTGGLRALQVDKVNDGPDDLRICFRLESYEIGRDDETGEATTAPIVEVVEGESPRPKGPKLNPTQKIALQALRKAADEAGEERTSEHIPQGVKVVTVSMWREYAERMGISPADTADARRVAFRRAFRDLVSRRLVGTWDELAWPAGERT